MLQAMSKPDLAEHHRRARFSLGARHPPDEQRHGDILERAEFRQQMMELIDETQVAIAQDAASGRVLMFAYMNREALRLTVETGEAHYWSRSRNRLWHKGEESGHVQRVRGISVDCDADVVLLEIEQGGGIACHTGRESCFFRRLENGVEKKKSENLINKNKS